MTLHVVAMRFCAMNCQGMMDILSIVAECLIGHSVYVTERDVHDTNDRYSSPNRSYYPIYNHLLQKDYCGFLHYRFIVAATKYNHHKRSVDFGCGHLITSRELANLWLGSKGECNRRMDFKSEKQYYDIKRIGWKKAIDYIDDKVEDYPFQSKDDDSYNSNYEEFGGENPFVGGDDDDIVGFY